MTIAVSYKYFDSLLWIIDQNTGGSILTEFQTSVFINNTVTRFSGLYKDPPVEAEQHQSYFNFIYNWVPALVYSPPPPLPPPPLPTEFSTELLQIIKTVGKKLGFQ